MRLETKDNMDKTEFYLKDTSLLKQLEPIMTRLCIEADGYLSTIGFTRWDLYGPDDWENASNSASAILNTYRKDNPGVRQIAGYPEYFVTCEGDVYSFKYGELKPLSLVVSSSTGYKVVSLYKKNVSKQVDVHCLVALTFIPKPFDCDVVNHLDGNKENNHVSNLEWTDDAGNLQHAHDIGLRTQTVRVRQSTLEGNLIQEFRSLTQASKETGFTVSCISRCMNGQYKSYKGFKWERC